MKQIILTAICVSLGLSNVFGQAGGQKKSPPMSATGKIGEAAITINYSSPSVKGRKIWGELVPYNKVWRAGANEATTFETDRDIKVAGNSLAKGKYSIYMIPGESEWQVIFNTEVGQWGIKRGGETTRIPEKDAFTIKVQPAKIDFRESLEYKVNAGGFTLSWENVQVSIPIQ